MSEWISADTPPEEDGRYLVCLDKAGLSWVGEPWLVEDRYYSKGWSVHANDGEVVYWMPTPEPPLEQMILDKLAEGMWFLVPRGDG